MGEVGGIATYVIGDVQGCYASLQALLKRVDFRLEQDRLLFLGDLVNRGPDSLGVLRFLSKLGDRADSVLGNHDLHLLARASGLAAAKARDTLDAVLAAPDRDVLLSWLARRPFLLREGGKVLVHAGLAPAWSLLQATAEAEGLKRAMGKADKQAAVLKDKDPLSAVRLFTTLRTCHLDGTPCAFDGAPAEAPEGCLPWFAHPERQSRGTHVLFGHWSALGLKQGDDYTGLDTGCVWGKQLTALCLETETIWSVAAQD